MIDGRRCGKMIFRNVRACEAPRKGLESVLNDLIKLSGRTVAEEMDLVSRNVEERERGERTGNEPFGDVGVSMPPNVGLGEGTLAGALAAGLTGALGLGPAGAAVGGMLGGQPGVQGPIAPQVGTREFANTVAAGDFAGAIADMQSHGLGVGMGDFATQGELAGGSFTDPGHPAGGSSGGRGAAAGPYGGGRGGGGRGGGGGGGGDFSGVGTGPGGDMGAGMLHGGGMISEGEKPGYAQDVNKTLQEGEYVMNRAAVEAFGKPIFDALNKAAKRKSSA